MAVLSILNKPLTPIYNGLEKWIRSIAKDLPEETDWTDSTKGSWYNIVVGGFYHVFNCFFLFCKKKKKGIFTHVNTVLNF